MRSLTSSCTPAGSDAKPMKACQAFKHPKFRFKSGLQAQESSSTLPSTPNAGRRRLGFASPETTTTTTEVGQAAARIEPVVPVREEAWDPDSKTL
ncbi:hypothetical protein BP6252_08287 [Coleophoma cylindrospora]|uniref:Uncharacterized protein n=1 Tax=Coleophoma cylindrospora TaxID=1849047 RepID=A0A3D8R5J4_9HELO|nr:hypothetical protein BP6252_08287 [Coleophoma cylindrospora]